MEPRLDYQKAFPEGYQGLLHLEAIIRRSGLEPRETVLAHPHPLFGHFTSPWTLSKLAARPSRKSIENSAGS